MYKKITIVAIACIAILLGTTVLCASNIKEIKSRLSSALAKKDYETAKTIIGLELAGLNNRAAMNALLQMAPKIIDAGPDMIVALKLGLILMTDDGAKKAMFAKATKTKDYQLRTILAEVIGEKGGDKAVEVLSKMLKDRVAVVAKTAARALGNIGDKNAVKALIDAMKKHKKYKTGPFWDINTALKKISGKKIEDYIDWVNWFAGGKGLEDCDPGQYTPGVVDRSKLTSFFGIEIDSRQVIIIMDVSGSMRAVDPEPEEGIDTGLGTGTEEDMTKKQKKLAEERAKLSKERMRIRRAKGELIYVIKAFGPDVKFNIIAYSDEMQPWKEKLTAASESNRKNAITFSKALEASGLTHTDEAIELAFEDKKVDTIILVSDGCPTHIGGGGGTEMPADSARICREIIEWVREHNRFRKITIHTLGFTGANFEFMQKLAKEHNGTFKDIK